MSIPGPGETTYTQNCLQRWSDPQQGPNNAPVWAQDPALSALVASWANVNNRWETIKHLRALRLYFNSYSWTIVKELPQTYLETWVAGTLARISDLLTLGVGSNHLNIDWFGSASVNWWQGGLKGQTIERDIAKSLLAFLEASVDLQGVSPSAKPQDWTWKATATGALPAAPLKALANWPEVPAIKKALRIEWVRSAANASVSANHSETAANVLTLRINTPLLKQNKDFI